MTVGELIEFLQELPRNLEVIEGYSYYELEEVCPLEVDAIKITETQVIL